MQKNIVLGALCCALMAGTAAAQQSSKEWPHFAHDASGSRYSPLAQVTPANVGRLEKIWTFHMRPANLDAAPQPAAPGRGAPRSRFQGSEATPLVVNGILYLTTPYNRIVALNAITGKEVWAYEAPRADRPAQRGIEYWPGGKGSAPRLILPTRSGKLIELDPRTGELIAGFGTGGVLDLKTPDVMNGTTGQYAFSSPPMIYQDTIITGSQVQESPQIGASGDIRAWDIRTGKPLWTFHSIPRPGEVGHDTWEGDSWIKRSGVNVWTALIADEKRGIVYAPFGAPTYDRYGSDRHGANLFGNAIVAIDAKTGKYLWHFQAVHHDIWDLDMPAAVLIDVKRGGKSIPAVAVMTKAAILFILDRVTGKPLYDVNEVPVSTNSDVPGEQPWPTQPMSVTPPLGRLTYSASDLGNVRPELRDFCEKLIKDQNIVPATMFQPYRTDSTLVSFQGSLGGIDWGGPAVDPKRGLFIINSNNLAATTRMTKRPDGTYTGNGGFFWNPATREPCQQPPWGSLTAVDVSTGKFAWQIRLGKTDDLPAGQQDTGRYNIGSPLVTAGGLIFIGATDENKFRAFETATGKELWSTPIPSAANNGPISFQGKDGRQYIVVTATGGGNGGIPSTADDVIAYALPKARK